MQPASLMSTNADDPISEWLAQLPEGDSLAQHKIYERFARKIESIADRMLTGVPLGDSDSEDVAVKVLKSLFERIQDGRLEPPVNRQQLWNLLMGITRNKSAQVVRHKRTAKRGKGKIKGNSGFGGGTDDLGIQRIPDQSPNPAAAFREAEDLAERLESLNDDQLRQIALLRMAGYSNEEIAESLNCGKRTIERRVNDLGSKLSPVDRAEGDSGNSGNPGDSDDHAEGITDD